MKENQYYANNVSSAKIHEETYVNNNFWRPEDRFSAIYSDDGVYYDILHPEKSLVSSEYHKVEISRKHPLFKITPKSKVVSYKKVVQEFNKYNSKYNK